MSDIWADISTWSVLKWVILVLIAGFIGQFGRMLAEAITARIRLRRAEKKPSANEPKQTKEPAISQSATAPMMSSEKPVQVEPPSEPPVIAPVLDKKALKALAKARKKEAKKNKK